MSSQAQIFFDKVREQNKTPTSQAQEFFDQAREENRLRLAYEFAVRLSGFPNGVPAAHTALVQQGLHGALSTGNPRHSNSSSVLPASVQSHQGLSLDSHHPYGRSRGPVGFAGRLHH